MADKIQVAVRVRPVLFQKKDVEVHWACEKGMVYQIEPGTKKRIGNPYPFDQVFGTETQNHKIFVELVQPLIDSAMNGFNVTVLAYGQTASGKTYTMMGSQKEPGIVQLVVDRIFTLIEQNPERAFLLRCSYIEIYNETISDLLSSNHQKLKVQELAEGHVVVHNLIETNVNTPDAVLKLMQQGNKQRKVGGTSMNERSSRSHTIFRIIVESVPRDEGDRSDAAVIVSHINLVDLAGSEKASQTNATGDRFREGCAINTSLSALSLVIKQLSEGEGFVNFRDSKLTHILRASLGGNARTAIICNVTPTVLDETSSTLKFACSAKAVQNQPHVNEVLSDQALLRKYNNYIKDLEKKLKEKELEKRPEAIEEMQRLLQEKDMKINELKEQLVVSSSEIVAGRTDDHLTAAQRSLRRMTWGGNRLKELNFQSPAYFDGTPLFPRSGTNRQRMSNFSQSELALDEATVDSDNMDCETFLPAEMVFSKMSDQVTKVDAATMTDVPSSPFRMPTTPCTPVPVLRERMVRLRTNLSIKEKENQDLKEELEDLTNFTRLEQQIGVHAQATAKSTDSQESAEKLHQALQTANDMEVLYLDTQRKLSELQTEFRTKEAEYENQLASQQTSLQQQIDLEANEKKRIAKELSDLKEKFSRMEMDHAEADIHVQVISERYVKREAELRQTLQEAWTQLEALGQDPTAIQDSATAKKKLVEVEKELEEMKQRNTSAQSQIDSLMEELRQFKEAAHQISETPGNDDRILDNSLSGMCLSDELRDVMGSECSMISRPTPRPRKRPSSILSVALAKMDQSACFDSVDQDIEPSKKTRFSIQSIQPEELDIKEVKVIREYLVELQAVLVKYEEDYEVISQEKETIQSQLLVAQTEMAKLQSELEKMKSEPPKEQQVKVSDVVDTTQRRVSTAEEVFDSSCFMGDPSLSASLMDMEQSVGSDDHYVSCGSPSAVEDAEAAAAAIRIQKVEEANRRKQELEDELSQMTDRISKLESDVETKTLALEDSLRSFEAAQLKIAELEQRDAERGQLAELLDQAKREVDVLRQESAAVSDELQQVRHSLEEAQSKSLELDTAKESVESQLEKANQELDAVRQELDSTRQRLQETVERASSTSNVEQEAHSAYEKTCHDLAQALERVKSVETELELKDAEVAAAQSALQEACSKVDLLEQVNFDKMKLEELLQKLRSEYKELEETLELKSQELVAAQEAVHQAAVLHQDKLDAELEKKQIELNQALEKMGEMSDDVSTITSELQTVRQYLEESHSKMHDLQRLMEQLEEEKKENIAVREALEQQLEIKTAALEKAEMFQQEVGSSNSTEVDRLQAALNEARTNVEQLSLSNESLLTELNEGKMKIDELTRELQSKTETLEIASQESSLKAHALNEQLERKTGDILQLQSNLQEVQIRCTELQSKKDDIQSELDHAIQRIQDLEENLESECDARVAVQRSAEANAISAAEAVKEALAEKDRLELQLSEVRDRVSELTRALEQSSKELEGARAEIRALEQTYNATRVPREDLDALESEWKEAMLRVSHLEASLEEKTEQINVSHQNLEMAKAQIRVLENGELHLSNRIVFLEQTLENFSAQNSTLSDSIEQIRSDLQAKEHELTHLRSVSEKVTTLEKRLELADEETRKLSHIIDQKTELVQQFEERLAIAKQEQTSKEEHFNHLEQKLVERQVELEKVRASLESMQRINDDLVTKLDDKEIVNSDLRKNLNDADSRLNNMQRRLEDVQGDKLNIADLARRLEDELQFKAMEVENLRRDLATMQNDRELSSQLQQRLEALKCQHEEAKSQCQKLGELRDELLANQERSAQEISRLSAELESLIEVKSDLHKNLLESEAQKNAILHEFQVMKNNFEETEKQLNAIQNQRDEFQSRVKILDDQLSQVMAKAHSLESSSKYQIQRQLEEAVESLKRELVDARSQSEILRLNFETEEDSRKKKIERLEKELESLKQQNAKCKEQIRLVRHQPSEDGTIISLPKRGVTVSTESAAIQTDPIADKGFGFRWQMEQYVSDNERLRKKVSDIGERMEFYREKLVKYRNMYFQMTGQDPNQRPLSSSSQPSDRHSSSSSTGRENEADGMAIKEVERNSRGGNSSTPNAAVFSSISPQPGSVAAPLQQQYRLQDEGKVVAAKVPAAGAAVSTSSAQSVRWPTAAKKESLTKEEMEKINNCNPS